MRRSALADWFEGLLRIGQGWEAGGHRLALALEGINTAEVEPRLLTLTYRDTPEGWEPWLRLAQREGRRMAKALAEAGHGFIGSIGRGKGDGRLHHHFGIVSYEGSDESRLHDLTADWAERNGFTHLPPPRPGGLAAYVLKHQSRVETIAVQVGRPSPRGIRVMEIP